MHTKDFLAQELEHAGLPEMAAKAREGFYHDYLSPLDFPELQLDADLTKATRRGNQAAAALRVRHHKGEFDASAEESDEWRGVQRVGRLSGWWPRAGRRSRERAPVSVPMGSARPQAPAMRGGGKAMNSCLVRFRRWLHHGHQPQRADEKPGEKTAGWQPAEAGIRSVKSL